MANHRNIPLRSGVASPSHVGETRRSNKRAVCQRSNSALRLSCQNVSCRHAELVAEGNDLIVRELGSANGTDVNSNRIRGPRGPVPDDIVQFGAVPFRVLKQIDSSTCSAVSENVIDQALAVVQFDRLMSDQAVIPHYQAIVDLYAQRIYAYEVLARSKVVGLESPAAMFAVAESLNLESQLSQMIRSKAVQQTCALKRPPHLFLNVHPTELRRPGLLDSIAAIRAASPRSRLTLEIHEEAVEDVVMLSQLRAALREMDIGLAFDDFGAEQGRLLELAEVQPDYLKFDISLIHLIHEAPAKQRRLVASLVSMVRDMGVVPLAEGIECHEEHEVCRQLGFALAQGFYYGRPAPFLRLPA